MDSLEFEMAGRFCQRALEVEPDNLLTLDLLGHIHSELGDTQRAKEISFSVRVYGVCMHLCVCVVQMHMRVCVCSLTPALSVSACSAVES